MRRHDLVDAERLVSRALRRLGKDDPVFRNLLRVKAIRGIDHLQFIRTVTFFRDNAGNRI